MNQDAAKRDALEAKLLSQYALLDTLLNRYATGDTFLWDRFGWVEVVYTPMFMRFWFVEYYEGFELPDDAKYARVRRWRDACIAHPSAQQVTREEILKLYYDYARGAGNGALLPGRERSSFVFEPNWSKRPGRPATSPARSRPTRSSGSPHQGPDHGRPSGRPSSSLVSRISTCSARIGSSRRRRDTRARAPPGIAHGNRAYCGRRLRYIGTCTKPEAAAAAAA